MKWSDPIRGCDVLNLPNEMISCEAGIYVWKRHCHREVDALIDPEEFVSWCCSQTSPSFFKSPLVSIGRSVNDKKVFIRKGFLNMEALEVGSNKVLSQEKFEKLQENSTSENFREKYVNLMTESINEFGTVFYVGQASNLESRIRAHAKGATGLFDKLKNLGLSAETVAVKYLILEDFSKKQRELAEQMLTFSLFAPLTMRAG